MATVAAADKRGPLALREFVAYITLDPEDASEVGALIAWDGRGTAG